MQRRAFGDTGEQLSVVGFGGIVVDGVEQQQADRFVAEAVDRGVNYFDVAPSYGVAEERLGPALRPYRKGVFLACKTGARDAATSEAEFSRSLKRLKTDHFDLYQLHGLTTQEDIEQAFGPKGAMETLLAAKQSGAARYLGFSAHTVGAALEALRLFPFDSVLFPLNFAAWLGGFGPQVVDAASKRGTARLALKALARGLWPADAERRWPKCWYQPLDRDDEVALAVRFTLSLDVTAAVSPGHAELLFKAISAAESLTPLSSEELSRVSALAGEVTPLFRLAESGGQ